MTAEVDTWTTRADEQGVSLSEWLRSLATAEAQRPRATVELGSEPSETPQARRPGPGRPPLAERARTAVVRLRVTPAEALEWKAAAAHAGLPVRGLSRWLRALANAATIVEPGDEDE